MITSDKLRFQCCNTKEELSVAAHMRYLAYREVNAIKANDSKEFLDVYDGYCNSKSCIIFENEEPVASIRASVYSPAENFIKIPSLEVYGKSIKEELGMEKVIVESSRFVTNPTKRQTRNLLMIPFRFIILNILKYSADFVVTAVRPKHILFYKRYLTMEQISDTHKYPDIDVEMVLLAGDCRKNLKKVTDKASFYQIPKEEVESYAL